MSAAQQPPKPRQWIVGTDEFGGLDADQLAESLMEAAIILNRVGGAVKAQAVRQELDPEQYGQGNYVTTHLILRWESYAPAQRFEPQESENGAEIAEPAPA